MSKCGECKWFDGGYLEDDGTGRGECFIDPPIWVGPSPAAVIEGDWLEWLMGDGWANPFVGVAQSACRRFEASDDERWWLS